MKDIVLIGGGGHCRSVIEVIESTNEYQIMGILDTQENIGKDILGYKINGTDDDIPKLSKQYKNFVITAGQIKSSFIREKSIRMLKMLMVIYQQLLQALL